MATATEIVQRVGGRKGATELIIKGLVAILTWLAIQQWTTLQEVRDELIERRNKLPEWAVEQMRDMETRIRDLERSNPR